MENDDETGARAHIYEAEISYICSPSNVRLTRFLDRKSTNDKNKGRQLKFMLPMLKTCTSKRISNINKHHHHHYHQQTATITITNYKHPTPVTHKHTKLQNFPYFCNHQKPFIDCVCLLCPSCSILRLLRLLRLVSQFPFPSIISRFPSIHFVHHPQLFSFKETRIYFKSYDYCFRIVVEPKTVECAEYNKKFIQIK